MTHAPFPRPRPVVYLDSKCHVLRCFVNAFHGDIPAVHLTDDPGNADAIFIVNHDPSTFDDDLLEIARHLHESGHIVVVSNQPPRLPDSLASAFHVDVSQEEGSPCVHHISLVRVLQ